MQKAESFKVVCKSMQWQQQDWQGGKTIHNVGKNDDLHIGDQDEQNRSFDNVRIKYIKLDV